MVGGDGGGGRGEEGIRKREGGVKERISGRDVST